MLDRMDEVQHVAGRRNPYTPSVASAVPRSIWVMPRSPRPRARSPMMRVISIARNCPIFDPKWDSSFHRGQRGVSVAAFLIGDAILIARAAPISSVLSHRKTGTTGSSYFCERLRELSLKELGVLRNL